MASAIGYLSVSIRDYDGELGVSRFTMPQFTAANFAAQRTLINALVVAISQVSLGVIADQHYGNDYPVSIERPDDPRAQRELKWLMSYHDASTLLRYSFTISCADPAHLNANSRAQANLSDSGHVAALVAALQATIKSPTGGAIVIDKMTLVGRAV